MPSSVPSNFTSETNWKEKLEALKSLVKWIEENPNIIGNHMEHLTKFLKDGLKNWKESNLNLIKESFNLLLMLA